MLFLFHSHRLASFSASNAAHTTILFFAFAVTASAVFQLLCLPASSSI
jgi:hypothetical protein